jgi:hypothetical protein
MSKITKEFVQAALELADVEQSKINEREREIFGLSSNRLRAFLNNVCSKTGTQYLEVGVYRGATLLSAMYGNLNTKAIGIENYSYDEREPKRYPPPGFIWENMKSQLASNINRYSDPDVPVNTNNITMIEKSFQDVDWSSLPKIDVCFFDVTPVKPDTYTQFLERAVKAIAAESVFIFTNYSNHQHAGELDKALAESSHVDTLWKMQRISGGLSDATQYYSGILVVGLREKKAKIINKPAGKLE